MSATKLLAQCVTPDLNMQCRRSSLNQLESLRKSLSNIAGLSESAKKSDVAGSPNLTINVFDSNVDATEEYRCFDNCSRQFFCSCGPSSRTDLNPQTLRR